VNAPRRLIIIEGKVLFYHMAHDRRSTMTATNHDDQLGEIYPAVLNDLNCTFGVSYHVFIALAVTVITWFVALMA